MTDGFLTLTVSLSVWIKPNLIALKDSNQRIMLILN